MKGIILAGGHGTRLHPATISISKQMLPIHDKPMVYYPLTTLMLAGIQEIALISTPRDISLYKNLLGDGKRWGLNIEYFVQDKPLGLAHAFLVCEDYIGNDSCCLILGDNIFHGNLKIKEVSQNFSEGAFIFGYPVKDPERYGVISFDENGTIKDIIEKPKIAPSKYAIPGFYLYDSKVIQMVKKIKPSDRGELEITDLNREYMKSGSLKVQILGRGIAWFDTGTPKSMAKASTFISLVEDIQSYKIGCPEEVSLREGFINLAEFDDLINEQSDNDYREYLMSVRNEFDESNSIQYQTLFNLQP